MKTGIESRRRSRPVRALWLALTTSFALLFASSAWAFDMPELMAALAAQKGGEARFTEERFVQGLDGPLASSGTLSYQAPDKLARRTLEPRPESMSVDGNQVTLSRGGRTRTVALDSSPELLGMVEAMRGTLAGDGAVLQRYFRSTVSGSKAAWILDLVPLDSRLSAQMRHLRIEGKGGDVLRIDMQFAGGDRSLMKIEPAAIGGNVRAEPEAPKAADLRPAS